MHTCKRCGAILALRGSVWGCMNRFCTFERPVRAGELARLLADVSGRRTPATRKGAR